MDELTDIFNKLEPNAKKDVLRYGKVLKMAQERSQGMKPPTPEEWNRLPRIIQWYIVARVWMAVNLEKLKKCATTLI